MMSRIKFITCDKKNEESLAPSSFQLNNNLQQVMSYITSLNCIPDSDMQLFVPASFQKHPECFVELDEAMLYSELFE